LSLVYGNPYYTPVAGNIGILTGYTGETNSSKTLNLGIESYTDFGIKLISNTNISVEARRDSLEGGADKTDLKGLFSLTGKKNASNVGGIYIKGRKLEATTS